ncbi:AT-hook motif nuclear-localized protein 9-like [Salvia splendens]|uniref:AT-hook motif nuclear-localized protein 9-like n=1 Tax=Salvia splendens TaxID=180675 RepID=UPI001C26D3A4|nr:AT-hook motif nuclear-localized protein 9-like [Salvia splendens]
MIEVQVENGGGFREKRKRGRPRKQLGGGIQPEFRVAAEDSGGPQKRGRGRPKGSGKWQTLAASLDINGGNGGSNFSPYVIDIEAGENIVERIRSFSERTCDSMCIMSASGTISTAQIFLPASRGRILNLKCQANFSIIRLNGSHTYAEKGGAKICLLSVHLADPHNNFYGGAVASSLIAAGPTQIIVATFRQNLRQQARVRPPNNNITTTSNENGNENENSNGNGTIEVGVGAENEEGGAMAIINVSAPDLKSFQPPSDV